MTNPDESAHSWEIVTSALPVNRRSSKTLSIYSCCVTLRTAALIVNWTVRTRLAPVHWHFATFCWFQRRLFVSTLLFCAVIAYKIKNNLLFIETVLNLTELCLLIVSNICPFSSTSLALASSMQMPTGWITYKFFHLNWFLARPAISCQIWQTKVELGISKK